MRLVRIRAEHARPDLHAAPTIARKSSTALDCFERALNCDPGSARARMGIANVLVSNILDGWGTWIEEDTARAEQLLLEALQGDTDLPKLTHTWESFAGSRLGSAIPDWSWKSP